MNIQCITTIANCKHALVKYTVLNYDIDMFYLVTIVEEAKCWCVVVRCAHAGLRVPVEQEIEEVKMTEYKAAE